MCGIYSDGGALKCGMNLCCSHYGWCGTDEIHCGDPDPNGLAPCQAGFGLCQIIPPPSCDASAGSANGRSIGYYQASNTRDRLCNRISPSQIVTVSFLWRHDFSVSSEWQYVVLPFPSYLEPQQ